MKHLRHFVFLGFLTFFSIVSYAEDFSSSAWKPVSLGIALDSNNSINNMVFLHNQVIYASTGNNQLLYSMDNGQHWEPTRVPKPLWSATGQSFSVKPFFLAESALHIIYFSTSSAVYAFDYDGGIFWWNQNLNPEVNVVNVGIGKQGAPYVVSMDPIKKLFKLYRYHRVMRTDEDPWPVVASQDFPEGDILLNPNQSPVKDNAGNFYFLFKNTKTDGYQSSVIYQYAPEKNTWHIISRQFKFDPISFVIDNNGTFFIYDKSAKDVFQSVDQGKTWEPMNVGLKNSADNLLISDLNYLVLDEQRGALYLAENKDYLPVNTQPKIENKDYLTADEQTKIENKDYLTADEQTKKEGHILKLTYDNDHIGKWVDISKNLSAVEIDYLTVDLNGNLYAFARNSEMTAKLYKLDSQP